MRLTVLIASCLPLLAVAQPVVPGFERFTRNTPLQQLTAGEVLITELNCVACHASGVNQARRFQRRPAPILFTRHNPASAEWVRHWLLAPHKLKPGTLMPDLLHGLDADKKSEAVESLSHYLMTLSPGPVTEKAMIGTPSEGKKLYRSLGCAQCHAPDGKDNGHDIPLGELRAKYTHANLIKFLRDPLHSRPAGRMPRIPMTEQESAHLSTYLRTRLKPLDLNRLIPDSAALKLQRKGAKFYNTLRCANCHQSPKSAVQPVFSKPLTELNPQRGCLAPNPAGSVPHFQLNAAQRTAITAALQAKNVVPTLLSETHRQLRLLNCTACHDRKALGQPDTQRDELFLSLGKDLGDEGRRPPTLTGVGAKLTESALYKVLRGNGAVRPYLATRMPDFGEASAKRLTLLLAAADARDDVKPTPRHGKENKVGRNKYGRDLIGVKGLNCITCHQLAGNKSLGIQSLDLASSPVRLRPEWFRDYLINPAAFRPGTRMPSFWPEGKAVSPILGHNTELQIDSLWVYLNELEQTRLPEGLEKKGGFELKPVNRPIVFRTFMEGVGTHAIAVGFPSGVHAAFDSDAVGWATLWRGKFLDAESTWDDRFTPLTKPLGTNIIKLPSGPAVGLFQDGMPWSKGGLNFLGYRLSKVGTPTMIYRHGKTDITDTLTPMGDGLKRRMEFAGGEGTLWVRLGVAKEFLSSKRGVWIGDNKLTLIAASAHLRRINGSEELIAPIELKATDKTVLEVQLSW